MAIKFLNTVQVDTDVLYVDASSNKVGIGTTSPNSRLDVLTSSSGPVATLKNTSGTGGSGLDVYGGTGSGSNILTLYDKDSNQRLEVTGEGNVGIGTTSPSRKLQVIGTDGVAKFYYNSSFTNAQYSVVDIGMMTSGTAANGFGPKITFRMGGNGFDGFAAGTIGTKRSGADNTHDLTFATSNSGSVSDKMIIKSNGNVGIGTASPDSKLHVYANNVDAPTIVTIENGDVGVVAGQDLSKIEFLTNDASTPGAGIAASIRTVCQNAGNIFDLAFNTQNGSTRTERMRLTGAGKLGIGDTTPSYELDVTGEGRFTGDLRCLY